MKLLDMFVEKPNLEETYKDIYSDPLLRTGHTGTWREGVTTVEGMTSGISPTLSAEVQAEISATVNKWLDEKREMYYTTNTTGSVGLD